MSPDRVSQATMHVPRGGGETISFGGMDLVWKITSEMSSGAYVAFIQVAPPGSGVPIHIHHRDEESIFVIAGQLAFQLGEEKFTAETGDMVNMPKGEAHGFRSSGDVPAEVLFTLDLAPGSDYEKMFDGLTQLAPDDEEGMLRVTAANDVEFLLPLKLP